MALYFDFHFHPLGKRFLEKFNDVERQSKQCTEPVALPRIGGGVDPLLGHIFRSQACVSQSVKGGIKLGVANIVVMEHVFATRQGVLNLLELEVGGKKVIVPLDNRYIDFVHNSQGSYNQLMSKELAFYQWVAGQVDLRHSINLLSRKNENGPQLQESKLNLVLAIEGGHGLSKRLISQFAGEFDPVKTVQEYRNNKSVDFLYLTLTHLSHVREQPLCSHAYGFKLVKGLPEAMPQINGLTLLGKQVVRACVDTKENKHPILIDIKHMSLVGRHDFYTYRRHLLDKRPDGFKPPKEVDGKPWWPIIATHMGITGFASGEMRDFIKKHGIERGNETSVRVKLSRKKAATLPEGIGLDKVSFNPTSVGLFDDDIEEIVRSRGLIGISLDARILGFEGVKGRLLQPEYDYFSREDFAILFPDMAQKLSIVEPVEEGTEGALEKEAAPATTESLIASRGKRELYLFCLNVLHTVAVINRMPDKERHGKDGWDYVCVGSDYDGLIDSIQAANTAELLPRFEQELQSFLPLAEKAYFKAHDDVPDLLPKAGGKAEVKRVLRKLFYDNGERFIQDWWSPIKAGAKAIPDKEIV
ncbi:hypothetical protein ACFS7Z_22720 [Pontibacter toksunensis]|uniref:Membrane dipeptidase (Peptidase family M19) n=1 Tax=Pontibacter toksunensis TaxID=1332631 RepID=A0ABW6C1N5_9BACT